MVRLAGLPLGLTVASWKNVEYFSSLFRSRDLSSALRHGAVADMTSTCSNPFSWTDALQTGAAFRIHVLTWCDNVSPLLSKASARDGVRPLAVSCTSKVNALPNVYMFDRI